MKEQKRALGHEVDARTSCRKQRLTEIDPSIWNDNVPGKLFFMNEHNIRSRNENNYIQQI